MKLGIRHETLYRYSSPVTLGQHVVRLRPRDDGSQRTSRFDLRVEPRPTRAVEGVDGEGNLVTSLWFSGSTVYLGVVSELEVETLPRAPGVADAARCTLPMRYPPGLATSLARYLGAAPHLQARVPGAEVVELAARHAAAARGDPLRFLGTVTAEIPRIVAAEIRAEGAAHPAAATLAAGRGACRDLTVLFIQVCRSQGFAARFVSGYQARSSSYEQDRQLHAWAEVFIPGAGWRGYDPTRGDPVVDEHVALAVAPDQQGTMPVEGGFTFLGGQVTSTLEFSLRIRTG